MPTSIHDVARALIEDMRQLASMQSNVRTIEAGGTVENLTLEGARSVVAGLLAAVDAKEALLASMRDPYAEKGWLVLFLTEHPGDHYRFGVSGFNHYNGQTFSWRVPNLDGAFDLSLVEVRS